MGALMWKWRLLRSKVGGCRNMLFFRRTSRDPRFARMRVEPPTMRVPTYVPPRGAVDGGDASTPEVCALF